MQLFITDFVVQGNQVLIHDKDIIQQIKRVLRLKVGDKFCVQKEHHEMIFRYTVVLKLREEREVFCDIIDKKERKRAHVEDEKAVIIAMPNKWQKAELICQKLSEIGIQHIFFWPSERSLIKEKNLNKRNRIEKISQEATEQSRNRVLPKIELITDISKIISDFAVTVFDMQINGASPDSKQPSATSGKQLAVIGPEGGLTDGDYENFGKSFRVMGLGEGVLRMETAAIVGGWLLKHQF